MNQTSLAVAVITASVAVVVAIAAQVSTWSLEHRNRVYERRRTALHDLQDAALAVRRSLRRLDTTLEVTTHESPYGVEVDAVDDPRAAAAYADADALLSLHLARVESHQVVASVLAWREAARSSFLGGDEVTASETEAAWGAMNRLIGEELRVPGWWQRRRNRRR